MSEQRKYKKSPSPAVKRKWLTLFYENNASIQSIADDFGYPAYTVSRVLDAMDPKRKERNDKGKSKKSPTIDLDFEQMSLEGESPETQIEMFIQELMRNIGKKKTISMASAHTFLSQLTNSLRRLRSIQFSHMAKSLDVKIVESIIRRYEPQASNLRIIEVFKEESARVKAGLNSEAVGA